MMTQFHVFLLSGAVIKKVNCAFGCLRIIFYCAYIDVMIQYRRIRGEKNAADAWYTCSC